MDRRGLRAALLAAGVPDGAFQLSDGHESTPIPTDFWFLRPAAGGRWEIGSYERGRYDVREVRDSEEQACTRLYEILTGRA
jgi:hypothetical protein